ncbi:MAG: hypothetical protein IPP35_11125 [Elusimicrobia bacterium]|nr:hypothetical protein [Elusimicrobiota bacterium]
MVLEAVVRNQRDVQIAMKMLSRFPAKGRLILVPTSEEADRAARRAIQDRGGALLVPAEVAEVQGSLLENGQVDLAVADRVLRASFPEGLTNLAVTLALPEGAQPNADYLPGDSPLREALVILLNALRVGPLKLEDFQRHYELAKILSRQA